MPKRDRSGGPNLEAAEVFKLTYRGGLADSGLLNFYEFGRAEYGAARLIYAAVALRETGSVPDKITRRIGASVLVRAPYRGSFITEILALAGTEAVKAVIDVSVFALLALTFRQFRDPQQLQSEIIESAKLIMRRKKRYAEATKGNLELVDRLSELLAADDLSYDELSEIASIGGEIRETASDVSDRDLSVYRNWALNAQSLRDLDSAIEVDQERLAQLPPASIAKLSFKMRTAAQDMGLPLRRSADYVSLGTASNDNLFGVYDEEQIRELVDTEVDDEFFWVSCNIIEYNKEGKFGKLRIVDRGSDLVGEEFYFSLTRGDAKIQNGLIDALKVRAIGCELKAVRRAKVISRVLVTDIDF